MEILVDPADQSAHCMNISVGKLNWFWQCPLGLTRFYLHRSCFFNWLFYSFWSYSSTPKRLHWKRGFWKKTFAKKRASKTLTCQLLIHYLAKMNESIITRCPWIAWAQERIARFVDGFSLDCCKNKCANAETLSPISIRFCQCSTSWRGSQKRFYTGRLLPRSNPITLYSTLLTEKVPGPLVYLLNW